MTTPPARGPAAHNVGDNGDLTQPAPAGVAQPDPQPDTETTLDAATTPSNTGVDDPTVADRADKTLRGHGPR